MLDLMNGTTQQNFERSPMRGLRDETRDLCDAFHDYATRAHLSNAEAMRRFYMGQRLTDSGFDIVCKLKYSPLHTSESE